jgi:hypothetical protein
LRLFNKQSCKQMKMKRLAEKMHTYWSLNLELQNQLQENRGDASEKVTLKSLKIVDHTKEGEPGDTKIIPWPSVLHIPQSLLKLHPSIK